MSRAKKGRRLGTDESHHNAILKGLARQLFISEKIKTTQAKGSELRPFAEKLITLAKKGDVHARRQVLAVIPEREIVHKLFAEIAPKYSDRNGGYTRLRKLGNRLGDNAPVVQVELV
jgi:large subunit ribosomal protein L17